MGLGRPITVLCNRRRVLKESPSIERSGNRVSSSVVAQHDTGNLLGARRVQRHQQFRCGRPLERDGRPWSYIASNSAVEYGDHPSTILRNRRIG